MSALPTGIVTFLLTDIEGSTRLWELHPDAMGAVVARHDAILSEAIRRSSGTRGTDRPPRTGPGARATPARGWRGVHPWVAT